MKTVIAVAILVILHFASTAACAADTALTFRLIFPEMRLDPKLSQAMEEINLSVACGHIESVAKIPDLWNIEIERATSAVEKFHASAGLGTARITPTEWSGAIVIKQTDASCFRLSGSIIIGGEQYLEFPLSNQNLRQVSGTK